MDDGTDGTQDARGTHPEQHANPVPRPAMPQDAPAVPPRPVGPPGPAGTHNTYQGRHHLLPPQPAPHGAARPAVADWLDTPRPAAAPGIWRFGHRPAQGAAGPDRLPPVTLVGLLIPLVVAVLLWSLWRQGAVPYEAAPLKLFTPDDWWWGGTVSPRGMQGRESRVVYDGLFFAVLVYAAARLGSWPEVARHFVGRRPQPARALLAAVGALVVLSLVFPGALPGADAEGDQLA
jgi:hypothetical protein